MNTVLNPTVDALVTKHPLLVVVLLGVLLGAAMWLPPALWLRRKSKPGNRKSK